MGLNFAIDELYATGWSALDSTGCEYHSDGRAYPTPGRVQKTFDDSGYELSIRHVQLFDCYRAEWRDRQDQAAQAGAVVGQTETEAAVYALSQLRRHVVAHA
jgi:hypothetical protein